MGACQSDPKDGKKPSQSQAPAHAAAAPEQQPQHPHQASRPAGAPTAAKPQPNLPPQQQQQPAQPAAAAPAQTARVPRRNQNRPPPMTPERQQGRSDASARRQPSTPAFLSGLVLAPYEGKWYCAAVQRVQGDGVDLLWEDETFSANFPISETYALDVGVEAESKWGGDWYSCVILRLQPTIDVRWGDASMSKEVTHLRPPSEVRKQRNSGMPDALTPTKLGAFGRRNVLVSGKDVEIRGVDGNWYAGVVRHVGDTCDVEYDNGGREKVPLSEVRSPSIQRLNQDLSGR